MLQTSLRRGEKLCLKFGFQVPRKTACSQTKGFQGHRGTDDSCASQLCLLLHKQRTECAPSSSPTALISLEELGVAQPVSPRHQAVGLIPNCGCCSE